jgi:hypothetical protein
MNQSCCFTGGSLRNTTDQTLQEQELTRCDERPGHDFTPGSEVQLPGEALHEMKGNLSRQDHHNGDAEDDEFEYDEFEDDEFDDDDTGVDDSGDDPEDGVSDTDECKDSEFYNDTTGTSISSCNDQDRLSRSQASVQLAGDSDITIAASETEKLEADEEMSNGYDDKDDEMDGTEQEVSCSDLGCTTEDTISEYSFGLCGSQIHEPVVPRESLGTHPDKDIVKTTQSFETEKSKHGEGAYESLSTESRSPLGCSDIQRNDAKVAWNRIKRARFSTLYPERSLQSQTGRLHATSREAPRTQNPRRKTYNGVLVASAYFQSESWRRASEAAVTYTREVSG